ncbi:MAG: MBL fold metallo-hydrolase [Lachnospiraceae bacterium]|nr:MBL fold metallo-hydrolase [Lachnospiraceae bacterium]
MELMFIGADHEVTGSCHYLKVGKLNILVDCGMEQGTDHFENVDMPVPASDIDIVLITHAHIDHTGNLPLLYKKGFRGKIYATEATADLCSIMLRDCAHIQMQEAEWKSRKAKRSSEVVYSDPLYTMEDAEGVIRLIIANPYDTVVEVAEDLKIRFTDVGHLLGSSSIEVWAREGDTEKKIVFSGDIGNKDQPLIKDPEYVDDADYAVMESTYGDRFHKKERGDNCKPLAEFIQKTLDRGGNVVIPSFAVGRTQEVLYNIRQIKHDNLVTGHGVWPVYIDSPLAVEATEVFKKNISSCFDEDAMKLVNAGINPLTFPGLRYSITSEESKAINFDPTPKVIISASGMCDAGRIRHHLKHNLWREESTILFTGYQAEGTLGRIIIDGKKSVKLFGEPVDVQAEIGQLAGLSGHADKEGLLEWVNHFKEKPDKVFVVHGDDLNAKAFTECLIKEHGFDAYAPYSGTRFDLISGEFITVAEARPIKKKAIIAAGVFNRLLAAGERLMSVIRKNSGLANKEMARFADQINSLADKYDRKD